MLDNLPEHITINCLENNFKEEWKRIHPAVFVHLVNDLPNRIREVIHISGEYIGERWLNFHSVPVFARKDHPGKTPLEKTGKNRFFPPRERAVNLEKTTYYHIWQHCLPIYGQLL